MRLTERMALEGTDTPGVFNDVKVVGRHSRNRRRYADTALDDIARLCEGKAVYIDHSQNPKAGRGVLERFGTLQNVKRTDGQVRASLPYLESASEVASRLKEDVERKLNFFGLSIDCEGEWHREKDGTQVVTKVTKLYSVDLVSGPGTNSNLKEQQNMEPEVAPAVDPQIEALRAGVLATLDGEGDYAAKVAKLKEFIATLEGEKPEEETVQEQLKQLREQLTELKAAKPKKYVAAPVAPEKRITEQAETPSDVPPKDKEALRKWLRK
jgi:hypothetical protein